MKNVLFILLTLLMMLGCEDEKDKVLQGEVIIDDYYTSESEVNIKYRVYNSGSENLYGWTIDFTAIMDNGIQYILTDSFHLTGLYIYDYYCNCYIYPTAPGDTSLQFTASTPTPYEGVNSVSVKSVVFKTWEKPVSIAQQMAFGDAHWSLYDWVWNTQLNPPNDWDTKFLIETPVDFTLRGTRSLQLQLSGNLADTYGEFVSSDSLATYPEWAMNNENEISIVKDQTFYENIGNYNQFVGGWDDFNNRYIQEMTVGDTVEIILMTPNKRRYLDM